MSGHSKWAKIKRQKGVNDQKRGALFTKLAKNITLAAKEGGGDISMNFALRLAVDKAKAANMPSDNVERAIKKATGEGAKIEISRISYEALGVGGSSLIIDCQTDNTNRTYSEVRKIVETFGGKLASVGSISWKFEEGGNIIVRPEILVKSEKFGGEDTYKPVSSEDVQMQLMEITGIIDIKEEEVEDPDESSKFKIISIATSKEDFAKVLAEVEKKNFRVETAELIKNAKEKTQLNLDDLTKNKNLINELEEHEDVDNVWADIEEVV